MKLRLIIGLYAILMAGHGFAANQKTISSLSGSNIIPLPGGSPVAYSLFAEDQMRSFMQSNSYWACRFGIKQSEASLVLRFDDSKANFESLDWNLNVTYDIKLYDLSSTPYQTYTGEVATIDFNRTANYNDVFLKKYVGALRVEVKITSVTWTPSTGSPLTAVPMKYNNDIYFEVIQETERYYNMEFNGTNCTPLSSVVPPVVTSPVSTSALTQLNLASNNNQLPIAWNYIEGAESYDVEWLFVDVAPGTTAPSGGYPLDFKLATRINTTQQHFEIPMAYPSGILVYRVRAVGISHLAPYMARVEGPWSADGTATGNLASTNSSSYTKTYGGLDEEYNWQYSAVYAEEGKHKEIINYFDGSLRNRQTTTVINSDDNAVIAETKYDYQGRPAVQMLPTPFANSGLHFYTNFNPGFTKDVFDNDANHPSSGTSGALVSATDKTGKYYSNDPLATGSDAYVPDAQGAPYSQTTYMADGTGRIAAQSGVGLKHKLGSGHDTRNFYGTPGTQEELDRLFGSEVGSVAHYKKNMAIDPNGQVSVTYLDQEGRVIATALAGDAPDNLMAIDGKPDPTVIDGGDMLTGKNFQVGDARVATTSVLIYAPTTYAFDYSLNLDDACYSYVLSKYTVDDQIFPCEICKDCIFDLAIRVTDRDGKDLPSAKVTVTGNSYLNSSAVSCPPFTTASAIDCKKISSAAYHVSVTFDEPGSYNIEKSLKINQETLNDYRADFLEAVQTSPCGPLTDGASVPPCPTCDYICNKQYGVYGPTFETPETPSDPHPDATTDALGTLISQYPVLEQADAQTKANQDYESCLYSCNNIADVVVPDECGMKLLMLSKDMSPGGQYFDYLSDRNYTCSPADPCSPYNPSYNQSSCIDNWLTTNVSSISGFWLTFHTYISSTSNCTLPVSIPAYTALDWDWVRANWNSCFAKFLVQYHPEYDNYRFYCGDVVFCDYRPSHTDITTFTVSSGALTTDPHTQQITMQHSNLYDKVFKGDHDAANHFSNPLDLTSSNTPSGYISDLLSSPHQITSPPAFNLSEFNDPAFLNSECAIQLYCQNSNTSSKEYAKLVMKKYLMNFYKISSTTPMSLSIWYVMDDPDNIHSMSSPATITSALSGVSIDVDAATLAFFKNFHDSNGLITVAQAATPANNAKYEMFKNLYLGYKKFILYALNKTSYVGGTTNAFTNSSSSPLLPFDAADPGFTPCSFSLPHAQIRYPKNDVFDLMLADCPNFNGSGIPDLATYTDDEIQDDCQNACEGNAVNWINEIKSQMVAHCPSSALTGSVATLASIKNDLVLICTIGCDENNPMGLSAVPPGYSGSPSAPASGNNFNDVLDYYLGASTAYSGCTNLVSSISIKYPPEQAYSQGSCSCDNLKNFATAQGINWNLDDVTLATQIASAMNTAMELPATVTAGDVCTWLGVCYAQTPAASNSCLTASPTVDVDDLTGFPEVLLCPPPASEEPEDDPCGLEEMAAEIAYQNQVAETQAVQERLKLFTDYYISTCLNQLDANEHMTSSYTLNEYYYTLYYYDQAGNLIKTVPPEGVRPLETSDIAGFGTDVSPYTTKNVAMNRANPGVEPFVWPFHTMVTNYKYTTLNQIREQYSPDGGKSKFYYDVVGRLAVSQNAKQKQASPQLYSYTLYDALSRITEVGELGNATIMTQDVAKNETALSAWLAVSYTDKSQITRTYYDEAPQEYYGISPFSVLSNKMKGYYAGNLMGNLRNRVSCIAYYERDFNHASPPSSTLYNNAQHYSYDIHGNVKTLYVENTDLDGFDYDVNRMDYSYDLISGKVNEVHYNSGKPDQFHHHYEYDADNRITSLYTSRNGTIWEKEAKYFYYKHGPLFRTEIGDKQVQAADYAYTLQGWIKGVNSNALAMVNDIGKDGNATTPNLNGVFARDAFGYSLNYFTGDYVPKAGVGSSSTYFLASNSSGVSTMLSTALTDDLYGSTTTVPYKDLYNGNISSMATSLWLGTGNLTASPNFRSFRYDQLNRIMRAYSHSGITANAWQSGSNGFTDELYREAFKYDFNGNIKQAKRHDDAGTLIDDLSYDYNNYYGLIGLYPNAPSSLTYLPNNKLGFVHDANSTITGDDFKDQASYETHTTYDPDTDPGLNYNYDKIGNLVKDQHEEIDVIHWTVYGKIKEIIRVSGSTKPDLEYVYDVAGNRIEKIVKTKNGSGALNPASDWVTTYYVRDAQGNVMATYEQKTLSSTDQLSLKEQHIFGSNRMGMIAKEERVDMNGSVLHQTAFTTGSTDGWTAVGTTISVDGNKRLKVDVAASSPSDGTNYLPSGTLTGKTYEVSFDLDRGTAGSNELLALVMDNPGGSTYNEVARLLPVQGFNSYRFTARSGQTIIKFQNNTSANPAYTFYIDNITVKEIDKDRTLGEKTYELNNHLGNVLTTISDKKIAVDANTDGTIDYFSANVLSSTDYYAFGQSMPGRKFNSGDYKYGFNGKEKDDETYGGGNAYDFGGRMLDPRLGRWLSVDPLAGKYPNISPYAFAINTPISAIDPDGKDVHIVIGDQPVGTTTIRLIGAEKTNGAPKEVVVNLYKMTVTDDVTGKTSEYFVTRDAPVINLTDPIDEQEMPSWLGGDESYNVVNTSFEPRGENKYNLVPTEVVGEGAYALRTKDGSSKLPAEPNDSPFRKGKIRNIATGVQIHIGGEYEKDGKKYVTGSEGCFTLSGPDGGNEGIQKFVKDVNDRKEANKKAGAGTNIDLEVKKREEVKNEWTVDADGTEGL